MDKELIDLCLNIYLAGPCKFEQDGGRAYRDNIIKKLKLVADLAEYKIECFDPTKYFSYDENKHRTDKQVIDYYYYRLRNCDIVLVNCNNTDTSCGTCMEVQYAVDNNIPCIGYGNKNIYPWVKTSCQVVFDDLTEALDYIKDYYLK